MTDPRVELRTAATRLREMAANTTEGPWNYDRAYGFGSTAEVVAENGGWIIVRGDHAEDDNLRWIALMGPDKAELLAGMLEATAEHDTDVHPDFGHTLTFNAALKFARSLISQTEGA